MTRTADPLCRVLAEQFLAKYLALSDAQKEWLVHELANEIQCSIEDWLNNHSSDLTAASEEQEK